MCDQGINSRAAKGEVVKKASRAGMILANGVFADEGLVADFHVLPATTVGASSGDEIKRYISSSSAATGTIEFKGTRLGIKPAPVITSFSARSPNA
ncbi:Subtilisin-like protease SBT1.5 [Linum grandiflorum]